MRFNSTRIVVSSITLIGLYFAMASLMSMREILDARFYYSATEASNFFTALSQDRAAVYLKHQALDLMFLSSYSVLCFSIVEILFPQSSKMKLLAIVPGIFDLIETVSIVAILLGAGTPFFEGWLGFTTCLKWTSGCFLFVLIFARMISHLKSKFAATKP